jgi:uncharacterized membrane protein
MTARVTGLPALRWLDTAMAAARRGHSLDTTVSRWFITAATRVRVAAMVVFGTAAGVATGLAGAWGYAPLAGWDVAAAIFCVWLWTTIPQMAASATKTHATREDPGRTAGDAIVIVAAVASLISVGYVLVQAASASGGQQDGLAGLAVASIVLSWFTVHTLFALRYASLYYRSPPGGVDFKQKSEPRYADFLYLAFTIGMTFQVSDTDLNTTVFRATALRHALLAYLFGAVILAGTINLIASLGSGGGGGG